MNVYILTKGEYDEEHIIGVYARLEDAQEAAQRDCRLPLNWTHPELPRWYTDDHGLRDPYTIDSWEVDGAHR